MLVGLCSDLPDICGWIFGWYFQVSWWCGISVSVFSTLNVCSYLNITKLSRMLLHCNFLSVELRGQNLWPKQAPWRQGLLRLEGKNLSPDSDSTKLNADWNDFQHLMENIPRLLKAIKRQMGNNSILMPMVSERDAQQRISSVLVRCPHTFGHIAVNSYQIKTTWLFWCVSSSVSAWHPEVKAAGFKISIQPDHSAVSVHQNALSPQKTFHTHTPNQLHHGIYSSLSHR